MTNDPRDPRAEALLPGWGTPGQDSDGVFEGPVLWLAGGAALLLWTGLSLLLTSA